MPLIRNSVRVILQVYNWRLCVTKAVCENALQLIRSLIGLCLDLERRAIWKCRLKLTPTYGNPDTDAFGG
jgi:hypothetical protein